MFQLLQIFDMSGIVNTGCKSMVGSRQRPANPGDPKAKCNWNYKGIPTGGIYQFVDVVMNAIMPKKDKIVSNVFAFDCIDTRSFRYKYYPDYKSGRKHPCVKRIKNAKSYQEVIEIVKNYLASEEAKPTESVESIIPTLAHDYAVYFTIRLLKEYCPKLGFIALEYPEQEADDIIFNLINMYEDESINLYADDSDYAIAKSLAKNVTQYSVKGKCPILDMQQVDWFTQVFFGLKKDGIPSLDKDITRPIRDSLYRDFLRGEIPTEIIFDIEKLKEIGLKEQTAAAIYRNAMIVYPSYFDEKIILQPTDINVEVLHFFASVFGLRKTLNSLGLDLISSPEVDNERLRILELMHPVLDFYKTIIYDPTTKYKLD